VSRASLPGPSYAVEFLQKCFSSRYP
jgi:hypothetical protein